MREGSFASAPPPPNSPSILQARKGKEAVFYARHSPKNIPPNVSRPLRCPRGLYRFGTGSPRLRSACGRGRLSPVAAVGLSNVDPLHCFAGQGAAAACYCFCRGARRLRPMLSLALWPHLLPSVRRVAGHFRSRRDTAPAAGTPHTLALFGKNRCSAQE